MASCRCRWCRGPRASPRNRNVQARSKAIEIGTLRRSGGGRSRFRHRICNLQSLAVLSLEGFKDLSALIAASSDRAVSGFTRSNVALTRSGLFGPSANLRRSFVPAFPLGTPPSDQLSGFTAGKQILAHLMFRTKCHRAALHA